ncbi:MAG: hypothetical protein ACTHJM_04195 [Marmoricola sp.]
MKTGMRAALAACSALLVAIVAMAPLALGSTPPVLTNRTFAPAIRGITGKVGILIATDRLGAKTPLYVGNWSSGTAWSTSKVPVAIAALRKRPYSTTILNEVIRAIRASDNAAAHALWVSLGTGSQAAAATDYVLRYFGDRHTTFRTTYFGLSTWSLHEPAIFGARLACTSLRVAKIVRNQMGQVIASQRWGLGTWPSAHFKGGWGPDSYGRYTVRQFGILPYNHRWIVVAVGVVPSNGSFSTGVAELNRISSWLWAHRAQLPSFSCTVPKPPPTPTPTPTPTATRRPPPSPSPTATPTATATATP